jgi:ElaB/YqjD/DUF883 family membrane-anchored ribosome-binding protein
MYGMRDGGGAGGWIINTVSRNPEGLLLLAAGAALLLRSGGGLSSKGYHQSVSQGGRRYPENREYNDGFGERVGGAARSAGEHISETTDKIAETARAYASSAMEYADDAAQIAVERSRRLSEQAQETADYVVREQPWAVALAGLLAGAAVAAVFPTTRLERRTLGEAGQRIRSAAGHLGEQVMEAGMQAGERLSEVAEERGLTADGLKDAAREVGETFSSALNADEERSQGARPRSDEKAPSETTAKQRTQPQNDQFRTAQPSGSQPNKGTRQAASGGTPSGGRK